MRAVTCVSLALVLLGNGAPPDKAAAQTPPVKAPVVLELYTSQGCSSCPPADRLLKRYAERRDTIALSYNVDYWDYLGWKDTLGNPAFSARQRLYARKRGDGEVYTPQIVVNGLSHAVGSMPREIDRAIDRSKSYLSDTRVPLDVRINSGKLTIEVGEAIVDQSATIWLASVRSKVTVPVRRGENRGRTLTYHNVVRKVTPVGMWSGARTVIQLKNEDVLDSQADTCAILVQMGKSGPIVAARWMPSPN
ncbi:MAG: DUF1223 domain-containing protein [Hyphomicrobiaceae bacterium]